MMTVSHAKAGVFSFSKGCSLVFASRKVVLCPDRRDGLRSGGLSVVSFDSLSGGNS